MIAVYILLFLTLLDTDDQGRSLKTSKQSNPVKIGLLVPTGKSVDHFAIHGAEFAVSEANESDNYQDQRFELVVRSCEGPWGMTSKQVVNFVYEDRVSGIISSLDGENAHLAEQVATKTRLPILFSRTTDPTVTQAYVPWFFRVIPDDRILSEALINEIFSVRKLSRVALLVPDTYDARVMAETFLERAGNLGFSPPEHIIYLGKLDSVELKIQDLKDQKIEGLVFCGGIRALSNLVDGFGNPEPAFFGMRYLSNFETDDPNMVVPVPVNWPSKASELFRMEFTKRYGYKPGLGAAYTYDATGLLIHVIGQVGPDPEKIRSALQSVYFEGVTGPVSFDENGNRNLEIRITQPMLKQD